MHPFYQVRYKNVRCLPMKKYPYMIHLTVDEKERIVTIRAVIHTSQNTDGWMDGRVNLPKFTF